MKTIKPNLLVTGASGFLGKNLVPEIAEHGRVRILVRPTSDIQLFQDNENIEIAFGDLENNIGIVEALEGIDVVIHCAAKTMGRSFIEFYKTNCTGTANLTRTMLNTGISKILYISSHACCGPGYGERPMKETATPKPISHYGMTKKIAEDIIIYSGLSYTILRPVSIYGPHDTEILNYVKLINIGICPIVGFGKKYLNLIYVVDLIKLIIAIVQADNFQNNIYFINDGRCYSFDEVLKKIAETLNKKILKIYVPKSLALFIGLLNDVFLPRRKKLVTRDKIKELASQYWVCSGEALVKEFGFHPQYSFEQAIKETINWYKRNGYLRS